MLRLITPAAAIITTAEAKAHLYVEHADDDTLIDALIASATGYLERRIGRQFGTATWALYQDAFSNPIELRRCPVQSVTSIVYIDDDGAEQTLDPADFQLDEISEPARIVPAYGTTWPTTRAVPNAVTVTFTAGYDDVPPEARQCILLLVGHWFAHREGVITGSISKPLEFAIDALADSLRWSP